MFVTTSENRVIKIVVQSSTNHNMSVFQKKETSIEI